MEIKGIEWKWISLSSVLVNVFDLQVAKSFNVLPQNQTSGLVKGNDWKYPTARALTGGRVTLGQNCGIQSRHKRQSKILAAASWNFDAPLTPSEVDGPHCQHVLPKTKMAHIVLFQMVFALESRNHIGHLTAFCFQETSGWACRVALQPGGKF